MRINIEIPDEVHIQAKINATKLEVLLKEYFVKVLRRSVNSDRETLKMVEPSHKCEIDNDGYIIKMEERK